MERKSTLGNAAARLTGCALSACLISASGCGKPYVILNPQEGSYHVKISSLDAGGSPSGEIVEKDIASSPSGAATEVSLKREGFHRVEVKNASGGLIANFDLNLLGQRSTRFDFSNKDIKIQTLPRGFTLTSPLTLAYGISGIVLLTLGGILVAREESIAAKDGTCVEEPVPPAIQCREIYRAPSAETNKLTAGMIAGAGGFMLLAGIVVGIPEWRARVKKLWNPVMRVTTGGLNP